MTACLSNHSCHGNVNIRSLCIVDLHVAFNNIKLLNIATEIQQWIPFAMLSSYKIFRIAVNNIEFLMSSCKVRHIFVRFLDKFGVSRQIIRRSPPIYNFMEIRPVEAAMILAERRTDGHDKVNRRRLRDLRERA